MAGYEINTIPVTAVSSELGYRGFAEQLGQIQKDDAFAI